RDSTGCRIGSTPARSAARAPLVSRSGLLPSSHAARRAAEPLPGFASSPDDADLPSGSGAPRGFDRSLTVLIVVPTLEAGAADRGAIELVGILAAAGHRPLVVSRGGRLEAGVAA